MDLLSPGSGLNVNGEIVWKPRVENPNTSNEKLIVKYAHFGRER